MKKFNIKEPDKCDHCHNKILREFYDTEYNGVKQPMNVCPNCFKKGKCHNTIHYKNIDGFWYRMDQEFICNKYNLRQATNIGIATPQQPVISLT